MAPKLNCESVSRLVAEYQAGSSAAALSKSYGVTGSTVYQHLSRAGVTPRKTYKRQGRSVNDLVANDGPELTKRYLAGEHLAQLSEAYGSSVSTVRLALIRSGCTIRPKGPRNPIRGDANHAWRGGRIKKDGYWLLCLEPSDPLWPMRSGKRYALEHRIVLARALGRVLEPWESVHHIDGDRGNNDVSNLQLRHGEHGRSIHMKCLDCGSQNVKAYRLAGR